MGIEAHCVELENPYEPSRTAFENLITELSSVGTHKLTHSEVETVINTQGTEVMRLLLQGHLDERGPGESLSPVVNREGTVLPYKRERGRWLESLFGKVWVNRDEVFEEALHRDPNQHKQWIALVDGNKTQLDLLQQYAQNQSIGLTIILDLMHVLSYLWKAAHAFFQEGSKESEAWVAERLLKLLYGQASSVAGGIRRSATLQGLSETQRKPVDKCADYLLKYKEFLDYETYLSQGFPICSGVIEGTCRHLINDRMDLTGARWRLAGAEAVLKLRSLYASGDFEDYWKFHEQQEQQRNHTSRYATKKIPQLQKSNDSAASRRHLHLVE